MLAKLSKALETKVAKIINNLESQYFRMEVKVFCTSDPEIKVTLPFVDSLTITQACSVEYTDNIELFAKITIDDYRALVNKAQDLVTTIKIVFVEGSTGEDLIKRKPILLKYKCIIKNPQDLTKKYHVSQLEETDPLLAPLDYKSLMIDTYFQLIDEKAYLLRHKEVNFILHNVKILETMEYIRALFNISKSYIEPPDNDVVLSHFIVTPPKSFTNIFDYLQDKYGAYNTGLEYYYRDDTLYIFKPYDTNPTSKTVAHIYNVQKGSYPGLPGYHWIEEEKDIHIISNTAVESKNLTELGIENDGNTTSFIRSDTVIDGYRNVTNEKGLEIHKTNTVSCGLTTSKGMVANALVNKYQAPTSNPYARTSEMIKYKGMTIALGWVNAVPFSLLPGQKILYHYDGPELKYKFKPGRVEQVGYVIKATGQHKDRTYSCNAALLLRVTDD